MGRWRTHTLEIDFLGEFDFSEAVAKRVRASKGKQRQKGARTMRRDEDFSRSGEYIAEVKISSGSCAEAVQKLQRVVRFC